MITQTDGIVLNYTKYSDSSVIIHALTQRYGRQSLMVHGIGKSKQHKLAYFQPLFLVDFQLYFKPGQIQKVKEFKLNQPLHGISHNVYKNTIALFIAEILYRSVKEEYADETLFTFLKTSILILDQLEKGLELFHLAFMVKLARRLGFMADEKTDKPFYDLKEGLGIQEKPRHPIYLEGPFYNLLIDFLHTPFAELEKITVPLEQRTLLLEATVILYEHHLLNFKSIKSYPVLKEVFSR